MIRLIVASNDSGSHEEVYFTKEFDVPPEFFFFMDDMTISIDEKIEDLPSCFPMDYILERKQ